MKLFSLLDAKYSSLVSSIKTYLSKTLSNQGKQYGNNTIFGQLITVLTNVSQNIMLYIEDALMEQNKYTAQRKKSIFGLAALTGYTPHLGKAAGVQLAITFTPSNIEHKNILIKNHETLTSTQNGMTYNIVLPQEAIILSEEKACQTYTVYAVQGKFETQTFVVSGGRYYTQHFNFVSNLDADYLTVKVNSEKWDFQESLYDMTPDAKHWTYKVSPVGGIDVIFGNDCHGRSLKDGDVVEISYLLHDGEEGNMNVNKDTYFVFNDLLNDISGEEVDGNAIFNVTFATTDSVTSGSNSETIDQVRKMIGFNSRGLVLATPEHYKSMLNRFSFCGYNRTWSERGSLVVNSLIIKNYKLLLNDHKTYFDLVPNDFKLSDPQKASIINYINGSGNQLAGVSYNIFDPELYKYAMYIYIKLKDANYDKDYISNKVRTLVAEFFGDISSDIFIPKSDIIHLLKSNISEIDGVTIYILSEKNEEALKTGRYIDTKYTYDPSTGSYKKTSKEVRLYDGENPNIGLDSHGNIYLQTDEQFPVLMGGWSYKNKDGQEVSIVDPLFITYE